MGEAGAGLKVIYLITAVWSLATREGGGGGKNTQKNCTKKDLHDPDNHDGVITHLEPDILECEVKVGLRKHHYEQS